MTPEQQARLKARSDINAAIKEFRDESFIEQSIDEISSSHYEKLSRLQIDQGVVALVLHCNLSGGSVGDMDLYKLIRTYLWDEDARKKMNAIVDARNRSAPSSQ